jgi:carbon storage regulator CsrA
MLVLSRKTKQQIQIGPHVTITILKVKGETVRVGIEAPKDVCVLRSEVAGKLVGEASGTDEAAATVRSALASNEREKARAARTTSQRSPLVRRSPSVELATRFAVGQSSLHGHIAARGNRLATALAPPSGGVSLANSFELTGR